MLQIKDSQFVKSILHLSDRPKPLLPEFAFAGRSNVGKSSLINCLLNRKKLAKVSKQPGKTRTLNYFIINSSFYFVDLPGYGYAKVSIAKLESWKKMVEHYLLNNGHIKLLFVLIDASIRIQKPDIQLTEWLGFNHIPYKIIATKADKVSRNILKQREKEILENFLLNKNESVVFFSIRKKTGRTDILKILYETLILESS